MSTICSRCDWRDDCSGDCLSSNRRNVNMRECQACGKKYEGYPALSRRDNKTEICPDCGMAEALDAMMKFMEGDSDNA